MIQIIDKKKWKDFVFNHPHGNIFQTPEMYEVYNRTKNNKPILVSVYDENENITGIILAVIIKESSGLIGYFSSRSIIIGGPLIKDNNPQILDEILKKYNQIAKSQVVFSQFRNLWDFSSLNEIFNKNKYQYQDHLDVLNSLNITKEELWNKIARDKKKCINRASNELVFKDISIDKKNIYNSYNLIKSVYSRIKLPIPDISLFINTFDQFAHSGNLKTFAVYLSEELVGVRMVLCYKELVYDWYAGADEKYLSYRPNDILPYEIMKWGMNNGYEVFDFGGAGKPNIPYGVRDFKLKFGGELVNFGRFETVHKPFSMRIGKFGFKLYKLLS